MITAAGVPVFRFARLVAAVRGTKDNTMPMVRAFLSVAPEHNATPPILIKDGSRLTQR
ncbi:hypothetical protein MESS2_150028 [Mesorhizobium metallidurans STM 2683]|uniref:Uncharacterized protein n=1 Tax=Mesorhizobium metallidurans STM 2683 TaxID=1297569 RepID=M5ELE2_9HYPH|nr:hypothetical protein MESS2_150028 [Mesorhizobium metallidurans STM 2683]